MAKDKDDAPEFEKKEIDDAPAGVPEGSGMIAGQMNTENGKPVKAPEKPNPNEWPVDREKAA